MKTILKIGSRVELGEFEQQVCRRLARLRYEHDRGIGVKDRKIGPQSAAETDLEGMAAEIAMCKMLNLFPHLDLNLDQKGHDLILPDKRTIDVKATKYKSGGLAVAPYKKVGGDMFALMIGQFPRYTFKGVIAQEAVIQENNIKQMGPGTAYFLGQDNLVDLVGIT